MSVNPVDALILNGALTIGVGITLIFQVIFVAIRPFKFFFL